MGRTLHYQVLNQDQLSDAHLEAMLAVSKAFNTGKFADVWTCENFFLDPLASFPNWQAGQDWKSYERRYDELAAGGLSPLAIRRRLVAEGVAKCHSDKLWGVRPDRSALEASIAYWEKQGFLKSNEYGCADKQRLYAKLLQQEKRWQQPETFCREVKPEDFAAHPDYNAGEIMAGFHGEYYGLTEANPFDESMHAIAAIQEVFGGEGVTIQVAPKPNRTDSDAPEK